MNEEIEKWNMFIMAKKALIKNLEKPISIEAISGKKILFREKKQTRYEIQLEYFNFEDIINAATKSIGIESVKFTYDYDKSILNLPIDIKPHQIRDLIKEIQSRIKNVRQSEINQLLQIDDRPSIFGEIKTNEIDITPLSNFLEQENIISNNDQIYCSLDKLKRLDKYLKENDLIRRSDSAGAILKTYPDYGDILLDRIGHELPDYEVTKIGYPRIKEKAEEFYDLRISCKKCDLNELDTFFESLGFKRTNIYIESTYSSLDNGVLLEKTFQASYKNEFLIEANEISELKKEFPDIQILEYKCTYEAELKTFRKLEKLLLQNEYPNLYELGYNISNKSDWKLISFDFYNLNDFNQKYDQLKSIFPCYTIYDSLGLQTKVKIDLQFKPNDLVNIENYLQSKFKNIEFSKEARGFEIKFKLPYSLSENGNEEKSAITNEIHNYDKKISLTWLSDDFYKQFHCSFNENLYHEILDETISNLNGVQLYDSDDRVNRREIGSIISKASKSNRIIVSNLSSELSSFSTEIVFPDLFGDKVKVEWQKEAIQKIIKPNQGFNGSPQNPNLRNYIFDSSQATRNETKHLADIKRDIQQNILLKNINPPQIDAVAKAICAKDLALLQGPPGSGKTTVIVELIWQLIRQNQNHKILLTSESNLAVDNALDRLRSANKSCIKAVRFGNNVKEEEGLYFHYDRIMNWVENTDLSQEENKDENLGNNVLNKWMHNIANRINYNNEKYSNLLFKWKESLTNPDINTRNIFANYFLENVNIIGNTSSSAGSPRFIQHYQNLYNKKEIKIKSKNKTIGKEDIVGYYYFLKKNHNNRSIEIEKDLEEVVFDTVIMDEASKATPPELLLPMSLGKKNVIIGDHRQLPPSLTEINNEGFKKKLEEIGAKQLARNWSEISDLQISQFKKLVDKAPIDIIGRFKYQYRMHPQINNVIEQFYIEDGGLSPGEALVQNCEKHYVSGHPLSRFHGFNHTGFITPEVHTLWINVDYPERREGTSYLNDGEVEAVKRVLNYLKNSEGYQEYKNYWNTDGLPEDNEIGLISFYAKQLGALREVQNHFKDDLNIRLNTVDRFQGMERNIIIVSTVRSNKVEESPNKYLASIKKNGRYKTNTSLGFASAPERINVAFSRAKRLLIVIGNKDHFSTNPLYAKIISIIENAVPNQRTVIDFEDLTDYLNA